jgi:hypothetical protein
MAEHNRNEQIKEYAMGRACSTNGEKKNAWMVLVRKPAGKRSLRILRCKWDDNININLREIEWSIID